MAEESDSHDKTEEPTPRRLEEARRRGEVAKTADLPAWASMAAAATVVAIGGGWMARDLLYGLMPFIAHPDAFPLADGGAAVVLHRAMVVTAPVLMLIMASAATAGVAGNLIQTGFIFTGDKLRPDLSKVSPAAGFKRLFGIDGMVQFGKSLLKLVVISAVCWMVLKPRTQEFAALTRLEPMAMLAFSASVLRTLAFSVIGVLGAAAGIDWFWQRYRFMQRMRMSREEVKQELRQSEGDPHVKAKLRQMRLERSKRRMMQAVPRATVVVTNPTHYAVALFYEAGTAPVPQCLAKGVDKVALRIREVAQASGVPIVEDPPLARALFAAVEVDEVIPEQHYEAVAKVIGFILNAARKTARPSWR